MEAQLAVTIPRRWLTIPLAAVYLGCGVRTIRSLIWSGELKRALVSKRFVVDILELDRFVESRLELEIDPNKAARFSGRERATRLNTLYPRGSQREAVDHLSTVPRVTKP
jgi:hypothetical protein